MATWLVNAVSSVGGCQQAIYQVASQPITQSAEKPALEYSDFVSIMLTGVSVILAVLAIVIAVLALWGYSQFKEMTQKASKEHIENLLKTGGLNSILEDMIVEYISKELKNGDLRNLIAEKIDRLIINDADLRAERELSGHASEDTPFDG